MISPGVISLVANSLVRKFMKRLYTRFQQSHSIQQDHCPLANQAIYSSDDMKFLGILSDDAPPVDVLMFASPNGRGRERKG